MAIKVFFIGQLLEITYLRVVYRKLILNKVPVMFLYRIQEALFSNVILTRATDLSFSTSPFALCTICHRTILSFLLKFLLNMNFSYLLLTTHGVVF